MSSEKVSDMNYTGNTTADEIDIRTLWSVFSRRWIVIILIALVGAILAGLFGYFGYVPQYSSSVMLIIHAEETTNNQLTAYDVSYSSKLINTLEIFLKYNDDFRTKLNEMAGTDGMYSDDDLLKIMTVSQVIESTPTMEVTFTSTERNAAYNLAKSFELLVNDELELHNVNIGSIDILNKAKLATAPSNGNPALKYACIGFIAAFALAYGAFLIAMLTDNKFHKEDDIKEIFDYPELGVVPALSFNQGRGYGYRKDD